MAVQKQRVESTAQMDDTSILLPTYNESETVVGTVQNIREQIGEQAEVLIIDDDSPDRTWEIAENAFQDDENTRVIRRTRDPGLGKAVQRGITEASREKLIVMDADGQHPPEQLRQIHAALEDEHDIVVASRHTDGGDIPQWSRARRLVSSGATLLAKLCFPRTRQLTDPMSGFFGFHASHVNPDDLEPNGYKIIFEVLHSVDDPTITEVGYVFRPRKDGESNLTAVEYVRYLEHLVTLRARWHGLDDYIDVTRAVQLVEFGSIGALGAILNLLTFTLLSSVLGVGYLVGGVAAFLVAVHHNFTLNRYLTFENAEASFRRQYLGFMSVSIVGFVVYMGLLSITVGVLGVPGIIGDIIGIGGASLWNFLGSEGLAFDVRDTTGEATASES